MDEAELETNLRRLANDLAAQFNLSHEDAVQRLKVALTEIFEQGQQSSG